MGKYAEAKNCFIKGQQHQDEMGIKQWITWCDEKMKKLGIKANENGQVDTSNNCEENKERTNVEKENKTEVKDTSSSNIVSEPEDLMQKMPIPKIKHDWYQTETQVIYHNLHLL